MSPTKGAAGVAAPLTLQLDSSDPLPEAAAFDADDAADTGVRVVAGADRQALTLDAVEQGGARARTLRRLGVRTRAPLGVVELQPCVHHIPAHERLLIAR